jgi:RNA polymerase sigma-70 factor (ECF subfamily)
MKGGSSLDEARVIDEVRSGVADAFAELVQHYQGPIIRYLHRLCGNSDTAKDLAQDTFMKAYQGVLKTREDISFKAWLYRIATNTARDYHRRRRLLAFIPFLDVKPSDMPAVNDFSDSVNESLVTGRALLDVPQEQRVCIVLHFVEGLRYREVAEIVGSSEEAVRKRVARGSRVFRGAYRSIQGGEEE